MNENYINSNVNNKLNLHTDSGQYTVTWLKLTKIHIK